MASVKEIVCYVLKTGGTVIRNVLGTRMGEGVGVRGGRLGTV